MSRTLFLDNQRDPRANIRSYLWIGNIDDIPASKSGPLSKDMFCFLWLIHQYRSPLFDLCEDSKHGGFGYGKYRDPSHAAKLARGLPMTMESDLVTDEGMEGNMLSNDNTKTAGLFDG